jgi:hypothetical protein
MSLRRAKSVAEYVDWVKQAVFEVEDLKECLLYEAEELARFPDYLEPLEKEVRRVYDDMRRGTYHFGREDLPFMEIAHEHAEEIPFHTLLKQINETHRRGLEVEEDD